jgi:hypothetical protein
MGCTSSRQQQPDTQGPGSAPPDGVDASTKPGGESVKLDGQSVADANKDNADTVVSSGGDNASMTTATSQPTPLSTAVPGLDGTSGDDMQPAVGESFDNVSAKDAEAIRMARGTVLSYLGMKKELLTDVGLQVSEAKAVTVNWKLQVEKANPTIKVYTTYIEGNPWICCKAVVTIPADRDDVWALISNDYRMSEYDKMTAECKIVRMVTERAYVRRIASVSIWPVSARDVVSLSIWDELSDGSLLMATTSIDDPTVKNQSGFVRAFVLSGGYHVQPVRRRSESSSPETTLTFFAHTDLGGAIPASIVNMLATQTPIQMCTQMSKSAADPKSRPQLKGKALTEDQEIQKQLDIVAEYTSQYKHATRNGRGSVLKVLPSRKQLVANSANTETIVFSAPPPVDSNGTNVRSSRNQRYSSLIPTEGDEPRLFCGYMKKEGRNYKNWKNRYFILEKGILSYFDSESSSVVLGDPLDMRDYAAEADLAKKQIVLTQQQTYSDAVNAASSTPKPSRDSGLTSTSASAPIVLPTALTVRRQLLLELASEQEISDWMESFEEHSTYRRKQSIPEVCTGYMRKQGRFIKSWKERFFVLDRGLLSYYDSSSHYSPATAANSADQSITLKAVGESMLLNNNATVAVVPPNGLVVATEGPTARTLRLELDEPAELQRWKFALEQHIDYLVKMGGSSRSNADSNRV